MRSSYISLLIAILVFISNPAQSAINVDLDGNDSLDVAYGGTNAATESGAITNFLANDAAVALIHGKTTATKATNYTIGTDNIEEAYGGVIYVTGAATITAPAVASGMHFTVVTIGAIAVSLDVNINDLMYLDGTALTDGQAATNTSTTGDMISCVYYSADGWYCASGSPSGGHWEGP